MTHRRLLAIAAAVFCAWVLWTATAPEVPGFEDVKAAHQRSDQVVVDRLGRVIQEMRSDPSGRRLEWVALDEVSPRLMELLILAEDRDFRTHHGIDWGAMAVAAWETLSGKRRRGASTLTMQLAALLDPELQPRVVHRTLLQKWGQLRAAWVLEDSWQKDQILEAYLNLVSFRGELQGIAAASRGLFDKQPHGLDGAEVSILVALLRSPSAGVDAVWSRARHLASAAGLSVSEAQLQEQTRRALGRPYRVQPRAQLAPHMARRALAALDLGDSSGPIETTLDAALQQAALDGLQEQLRRLAPQNVHDGAVLIVDNRSGEILAYVGNGGHLSSAVYVDGIQARRQAGSTLKPFLYALALGERVITPATPLNDAPLNINVNGAVYRPSNYDNRFRGLVSARLALASSLNIPAVRLLELVGEDRFISRLRELGFGELRSAEYYGPALALGTADVTLEELVNAYRTLANQGMSSRLSWMPAAAPVASHRVYSEVAAFLVSDILSDRESRSATFGLESPLATPYWSAVKTGTSKDMRDNWCIGYSSEVTAGVWIGNFSGQPMYNVSGISGAAPLWRELMDRIHRHRPSHKPSPPQDVIQELQHVSDSAPPAREWFAEGTEEERSRTVTSQAAARILYPPHQAVLAMDPDIPDRHQRIYFEAAAGEGYRWRLNGEDLGPARLLPWRPTPGQFILELVDAQGQHRDGVKFSVRGAAGAGQTARLAAAARPGI